MSTRERIAVELRFIEAFQRAVGGPDAVLTVWHQDREAFNHARELAAAVAWGNAVPAAGATFELSMQEIIDL